MTWGLIGAAGISAASAITMAAMDDGSDAGGYEGGKVITMPTYEYNEPMRTLQADGYMSQMKQTQEFFENGDLPPWLKRTSDLARSSMERPLKERFYGSPMGGPGIMQNIKAGGAATGVGPAATMRQTLKVNEEYSRRSQAIDETLAKLGATSMMQMYSQTGQLVNAMPQGPPSRYVAGNAIPQKPDYTGQAMQGIAAALPGIIDGWNNRPQDPEELPKYTTDPWHPDATKPRTSAPQGISNEEQAYNQMLERQRQQQYSSNS